MKTLLENLVLQHKVGLLVHKERYPALHESSVKCLREKYYWSDLTMFEAINIANLLEVPFSIDSINDLFEYSRT